MLRSILLLALFLTMCACRSRITATDKSVVPQLNISRYLGTWYEIARYNHSFERGLVGVTATYSLLPDGKIRVVNAGYEGTLSGARSEAVGKAKIPDATEPARLKVSFFWFFYADYFVLELDPGYQWAVVGSSSDKYLWILSRTPQIDDGLYRTLLEKITSRGYDVSKLIKVEQPAIN